MEVTFLKISVWHNIVGILLTRCPLVLATALMVKYFDTRESHGATEPHICSITVERTLGNDRTLERG